MKRKKSFIHIDWKIGLIFLVFSVCCRTVYAQTVSVELKKATVAEALKKIRGEKRCVSKFGRSENI